MQTIGVGSAANDGTGDTLRTAFLKVNANTAEAVQGMLDLGPLWWQQDRYKLDGTSPILHMDFVRDRFQINGLTGPLSAIGTVTSGQKRIRRFDGAWEWAAANALAYGYPSTKRRLILEGVITNLWIGSAAPVSAQNFTVTAQSYVASFIGTGSLAGTGAATFTRAGTGKNDRVSQIFTPTAGTLTLTPTGDVREVQLEANAFATSYVETTSGTVARTIDAVSLSSVIAPLFAGNVTFAFRGRIANPASAGLLGATNTSVTANLLLRSSTGQISARVPGDSDSILLGTVAAEEVGVCWGADGTGLIGSVNGLTPVTSSLTTSAGTTSAVTLQPIGGLAAGVRTEIDEIIVWAIKGTSAAIQAQAHVYAP